MTSTCLQSVYDTYREADWSHVALRSKIALWSNVAHSSCISFGTTKSHWSASADFTLLAGQTGRPTQSRHLKFTGYRSSDKNKEALHRQFLCLCTGHQYPPPKHFNHFLRMIWKRNTQKVIIYSKGPVTLSSLISHTKKRQLFCTRIYFAHNDGYYLQFWVGIRSRMSTFWHFLEFFWEFFWWWFATRHPYPCLVVKTWLEK